KAEVETNNFKLYELENNSELIHIDFKANEYKPGDEIIKLENHYMNQLKNIQDTSNTDRKQLFYCFESMGLLNASLMCLADKDENIEEFYLYCEVLIKKGEYAECLVEIDTWIINKKLDERLSIEFK